MQARDLIAVLETGCRRHITVTNEGLPSGRQHDRPSAAIRGDLSRCVAASPKRPRVKVQICERSTLHILNESAPGFLDRQLPACAVCELRNELDVPIVVAEGVVDPVE